MGLMVVGMLVGSGVGVELGAIVGEVGATREVEGKLKLY